LTKAAFLLIFFAILLCVGAVTGQEEAPRYTLREPSAQEYVDQVEAVLARAQTNYIEFYTDQSYLAEAVAMAAEINWRFLDQQALTYDQLNRVFHSYSAGMERHSTPPDERWMPKIIELWLAENPTYLSSVNALKFDDYTIQISPLSLFADGLSHWGYVTEVVDGPPYAQGRYIAVPLGSNNNYLFPDLPVSMDSAPLVAGDLNNDKNPDVAYLSSSHMGNSYNSGALNIITFRDNRFELLESLDYSEGPTFALPPQSYSWLFAALDSTPDIEIIENQELSDNWGCGFIQVTIFEWQDDGKLTPGTVEKVFPQTFGCLHRQAEEAMWAYRYAEAINFFEQALSPEILGEKDAPYTQMRLGLAYLLAGQADQARNIFTNLQPGENAFVQAAQQAYQDDPRPLAVCQAMYNYALENPYPDQVGYGSTLEYDGGFYGYNAPYFDVENTSCNLAAVLDDQLTTIQFSADQSPVEQLEALGLAVDDFISEDFDLDGDLEWLVWTTSLGIDPIFFAPDGEGYQISRLPGRPDTLYWFPSVDLRVPDEHNHYSFITLPDGLGKALVDVDFSLDRYSAIACGGMCGGGGYVECLEDDPGLPRNPGDLTLWRLEKGELVNFFFSPLCKASTLEELFPDGDASTELIAADYSDSDPIDEVDEVIEASYFWDSTLKTYIQPPEPTPTATSAAAPTETPIPTPTPNYGGISDYGMVGVSNSFKEGDYDLVLQMTDLALTNASGQEESLALAFRYYRALALEALERPDEALAEYVAIYEAAPESAWGMLANLHIGR